MFHDGSRARNQLWFPVPVYRGTLNFGILCGCGSLSTLRLVTIMETTNLADLYGLPTIDWAIIEDRLARGFGQAPGTGGPDRHTSWLATINRDWSPHVTGVGALWFDGAFWFETGERTRIGRNLKRDPRCTLSLATNEFDLVIEGGREGDRPGRGCNHGRAMERPGMAGTSGCARRCPHR
jgi:Pyridoxamine 5'-phosphate oxidase